MYKKNAWVSFFVMGFIGLTMLGCRRQAHPVKAPTAPTAKPEVITNRIADVTYLNALRENRDEQQKKAMARRQIDTQMAAMFTKVKATLPAGADDAAVKVELAKDPAWRALEVEKQRLQDEIQQTFIKARETVRQRLLAEKRDIQAVAEGRAVAVDPLKGKAISKNLKTEAEKK